MAKRWYRKDMADILADYARERDMATINRKLNVYKVNLKYLSRPNDRRDAQKILRGVKKIILGGTKQ